MQALVYKGQNDTQLETRAKPTLRGPDDAIVKITYASICGTDLHILKGDVPTCLPNTVLGHEGVGVIEALGSAVTRFEVGDRVIISCISACGRCDACRKGMNSHCETGGWLLGHTIDGTQAEYVRIPHAQTSLHKIAPGADEEAMVMLSDALPTAFECGVLNGRVQPGSTVAIVGAGPIGLATLLAARLYSPSQIILIDLDANRLAMGMRMGATASVLGSATDAVAEVMRLTGGRGVDTAIEAVGIASTFSLCQEIVAAGGTLANIGVHGAPVTLRMDKLWSHNIAITTRITDTVSTPMLLKCVACAHLDAKQLITHRFKLADGAAAYATFAHAAEHQALKVLIAA